MRFAPDKVASNFELQHSARQNFDVWLFFFLSKMMRSNRKAQAKANQAFMRTKRKRSPSPLPQATDVNPLFGDFNNQDEISPSSPFFVQSPEDLYEGVAAATRRFDAAEDSAPQPASFFSELANTRVPGKDISVLEALCGSTAFCYRHGLAKSQDDQAALWNLLDIVTPMEIPTRRKIKEVPSALQLRLHVALPKSY